MEAFVEFIQAYWQYLSFGLLFIVEVLVFFLKKRPQTVDDFKSAVATVCNYLPSFIQKVEVPGRGCEKKEAVIALAFKGIKAIIGRDITNRESDYIEEIVSEQIEKILETPTKKGKKL